MGGGLLGEVVVGCRRIPHGEAVMVLGSDEQHSHAGVFGLLTPGGGIEVGSIEGLRGSEVLLAGDSRQGDATIPGLLVPPCLDLLGVADFLLCLHDRSGQKFSVNLFWEFLSPHLI